MAAALAMLLAAEGCARTAATRLQPVLDWPRADYVMHEQGLGPRAAELDLLVLGSSVVGRAIAPDALAAAGGPSPGYNYWLAGPPMRSITLLATDVLLTRTTPSVVVLGLTMREFNDGPSQRDHIQALRQSYGYLSASGRATTVDRLDHRLQSVSHLARYRGTLRDPGLLAGDLRQPPLEPEHLGPDGFLLDRGDHQLADEPPSHLAQERFALADYTVSDDDVAALGQLLDTLQARGAAVLVVNLPVTGQFIALADDGRADYDDYRTRVAATVEGHGARWLDTMTVPWPDDLFGDVNHLNDRGAAALQPLVLEALPPLAGATGPGPGRPAGPGTTGPTDNNSGG